MWIEIDIAISLNGGGVRGVNINLTSRVNSGCLDAVTL